MAKQTDSSTRPQESFEQSVDRCLSLVLHHEEIEQIAAIIKRVHQDRSRGITNAGERT